MKSFKVTNINDLELIYSILRERYPQNEIGVLYNWNIKEYTISVTDKTYKYDPEIPVDININYQKLNKLVIIILVDLKEKKINLNVSENYDILYDYLNNLIYIDYYYSYFS